MLAMTTIRKSDIVELLDHVIASCFLAKQSPTLGDRFVTKDAPRDDMHNGFGAGLSSYRISIEN